MREPQRQHLVDTQPRKNLARLIRSSRPIRLIVICVAGLLSVGGLLTFCVGGPGYYSAKYAPVMGTARPSDRPEPLQPGVQTEPHTCGYHAVSSVYAAYGLDPDLASLRFRLGTDKPVNLLAPSSVGTIHPDMLRVLRQDGFTARHLFPGAHGSHRTARAHLDDGHPILALTKPAGLHWVVLHNRRSELIEVCDSIADEPYDAVLDDMLDQQARSLLLIRPAATATEQNIQAK